MLAGLFIMVITFVAVGLLHLFTLKAMRLSETKKTHYRKFFWYIYGVVFMLSGGVNLIEKENFHWSFCVQFLLGLSIVILNILGKIETKSA